MCPQIWSKYDKYLPTTGQSWAGGPDFGRARPQSAQILPTTAQARPSMGELDRVCSSWANFGLHYDGDWLCLDFVIGYSWICLVLAGGLGCLGALNVGRCLPWSWGEGCFGLWRGVLWVLGIREEGGGPCGALWVVRGVVLGDVLGACWAGLGGGGRWYCGASGSC